MTAASLRIPFLRMIPRGKADVLREKRNLDDAKERRMKDETQYSVYIPRILN